MKGRATGLSLFWRGPTQPLSKTVPLTRPTVTSQPPQTREMRSHLPPVLVALCAAYRESLLQIAEFGQMGTEMAAIEEQSQRQNCEHGHIQDRRHHWRFAGMGPDRRAHQPQHRRDGTR